ncbi:MAG: hypothetical protein IPJ79_08155 [Bacteroidetes bacterium]|nr:hypothetical protein [Bacteroidota bacterium]
MEALTLYDKISNAKKNNRQIFFYCSAAAMGSCKSKRNISRYKRILPTAIAKTICEREQKFKSYSESLLERNGIFGGKTKKDVLRSNEILKDLVKNDNQIINVLNRVVDFRNYEKFQWFTINWNIEQRLDNLLRATDTLSKQVTALKQQNNKLQANNRWLIVLAVALFILSVVLIIKHSALLKTIRTACSNYPLY